MQTPRRAFVRALQVSRRGSLLDAMILEIGELTPDLLMRTETST